MAAIIVLPRNPTREDILTPTPEGLKQPCLDCLSESDLWKAFLYVLANASGYYTLPDDLTTLLEDSKCFQCLTPRQMEQALVDSYSNRYSIPVTKELLGCLNCMNPQQVRAAILAIITRANNV